MKGNLNMALVGGGSKSRNILACFRMHAFREVLPSIVAVVDTGDDAPAVTLAEELGIGVTKDFREVLRRQDIDLIVDLTGDPYVSRAILEEKPDRMRFLDGEAAQLLWEFSLVRRDLEETQGQLARTKTLSEASINAFYRHEDVMLIGSDYRILDINDTMLNRLGLARTAVVGMHCYEISHDRDKPCDGREHPCPLVDCLVNQTASHATHIHRDRRNEKRYFSISCYPIFNKEGTEGGIEISKDITADILLQERLEEQQKLASVGQLAAGVAHEINNPLTTVLTTAMLMQEDMDPEDPNYQELETIAKETLRCRKIVTSLLDFARQSKPAKALHDLNMVVLESMTLTRKQAAFKDVFFETDLSERVPSMSIDKDQIQQCIINLALNGIEATAPGGRIRFTTRLVPENETVEVTVSDTGKGIPEGVLERVFEPFFTTRESGTGLGLAITHGIIQQHGGTIEVKSKVGEGTTFSIHLPLRKGDEDAGQESPNPGG